MSAKTPPKPSKDTVYIDADDEITSIIDKVENAENKVIALVLPKRAASLQSVVNMKLLKRSADSAGKNVVLITSEQALIPLAGAAGLHVAKNLQTKPEVPVAPAGAALAAGAALSRDNDEAPEEVNEDELPQKYDYGSLVGALADQHEAENPETIDLDDGEENKKPPAAKSKSASKDSKLKVPDFDKFRMLMFGGAAALILLIIFLFLASSVLPKAKITIHTTSEPVAANFNLTANTAASSLDSSGGVIPAKLETSDQTGSQQVTATGQQNNGQKASGTVTISAGTCGPNFPSDVPAGTGISTNGLTYITQSNAAFNAKNSGGHCVFQSNSVPIVSQQPGGKYNTSLSGATVAGYSGDSADGSASGGSDNIVTILSQSDVDQAAQKLTGGSSGSDFTKSFQQKLESQGAYVLTSTMKISTPVITASPSVGQPASTANVSIKVTYSVLTIKKSDLSEAIENKVSDQIDKTKQKLNGNFLNDASITVQSVQGDKSAVLAIDENTTAVPIINVASVKKVAEGSKTGDIKSVIGNWPGVKSVDVNLSPFWVSKAPKKDSKVKVVLLEDKSTSKNNSGAP